LTNHREGNSEEGFSKHFKISKEFQEEANKKLKFEKGSEKLLKDLENCQHMHRKY
jgi:hypothetical protein